MTFRLEHEELLLEMHKLLVLSLRGVCCTGGLLIWFNIAVSKAVFFGKLLIPEWSIWYSVESKGQLKGPDGLEIRKVLRQEAHMVCPQDGSR